MTVDSGQLTVMSKLTMDNFSGDGRFTFAFVVPTMNKATPVLRIPRLKTSACQRNRRERPMCRSAPERTELLPKKPVPQSPVQRLPLRGNVINLSAPFSNSPEIIRIFHRFVLLLPLFRTTSTVGQHSFLRRKAISMYRRSRRNLEVVDSISTTLPFSSEIAIVMFIL